MISRDCMGKPEQLLFFELSATAWKVSKYGVSSGPNTGKYGPEKITYLDSFHTVCHLVFLLATRVL